MDIAVILRNIYNLPNESLNLLMGKIEEVSFSKGQIILRANVVERSIYFIKQGLVRAYSNEKNAAVTFWFGKEGDAVISMRSYVEQEIGYEDVETLENCTFYKLSFDHLNSLYASDIHIANWGRKFAERELIQTEKRLISRQFKTASERYEELLNDHPYLVQRVQLSHIASYLGISQVSLSRIRAEKK